MTYSITVLNLQMDIGDPILDGTNANILDDADHVIVDGRFVDWATPMLSSSVPVSVKMGNSGNSIKDRVANIGTLKFALYNYEFDAGPEVFPTGWSSPDHINLRSGFGLGTRVMLILIVPDKVPAQQFAQFYGKITAIEPMDGQYGEKLTIVTMEDWMAEATRVPLRGLTVQTGQRDDQILTSLLTLATSAPAATDFSAGLEAYNYALHDELGERTKLIGVMQKLALSGLGKIYLRPYLADGFDARDKLYYRMRSDLMNADTLAATLDNTMHSMKVARRTASRIKRISATTYPSALDSVNVVLWSLTKEIVLQPGATYSFAAGFRDPSGKSTRIAALSLVTPVAGTDYNFSSSSGSGSGLNANLDITVVLGADQADITIHSSAPVTGYLWLLQLRGQGLYLYDAVEHRQETDFDDGEYLSLDMPYQDDFGVGEDISALLKYWYANDRSEITGFEFTAYANSDDNALYDAAIDVQVGDLVSIREAQTGIYGTYYVNGIEKTFVFGGYQINVRWTLERAYQVENLFFLDVVGACELDSTPILGV